MVFDVRQSADAHRANQCASADDEGKSTTAGDKIADRQAELCVEVVSLSLGFEPDLKRTAMKTMDDRAFAACPSKIVDGRARQQAGEHHVGAVPYLDCDGKLLCRRPQSYQAAQLPGEVIVEGVELKGS
ncbi:hypothetical protein D3C78_1333280 [compost metagenome]